MPKAERFCSNCRMNSFGQMADRAAREEALRPQIKTILENCLSWDWNDSSNQYFELGRAVQEIVSFIIEREDDE